MALPGSCGCAGIGPDADDAGGLICCLTGAGDCTLNWFGLLNDGGPVAGIVC